MVTRGELGGGWGKLVTDIKDRACHDEHQVMYEA